jgi:outer membrane lipoprotein-sorting protein
MLKTMLTVLFIGVLLCGIAVAQDVDEIIAKNIEARGGMEKLKSVKTMVSYGKGFMGGMEVPVVLYAKRPGKMRMEMSIQGQTIINAIDGETGWYIMPLQGNPDPQKLGPDEIKEFQRQADIDGPLVDYKEKGHTVELIGKEDMEGSPVYKLKLIRDDGEESYLFLDAEYYLGLKTTTKVTREDTDTEFEIDQLNSDFKEVDGMMIPHAVEVQSQGQTMQQFTIDSIQVNVDIPDSLFAMPPVPEKPKTEGELDSKDAKEAEDQEEK